jgi:uncharacterized protein (DUF2252 family)
MKRKKPILPNHRAHALEEARNQKMARSASEYVRGSATRFYEWLSNMKPGAAPDGPPIWICGDCHVGNLGPTANDKGEFEVEIRDFDQTTIGHPAYDLVRLGLSLAAAATVSDLPGLTIAEILESMIHCYEMAFDQGFDEDHDLSEPKSIRSLNKQARSATWESLAEEDIDNARFILPLGRKFWPLAKEERREIEALFATEDMRELATKLAERKSDAEIEIVDAAFWKKGCSSLGRLRYAVLLRVGSRNEDRQHCLMDLKEAVAARSPHDPQFSMPRDHAQRVIAGARVLSPFLGDRMRAVRLMGKPLFVRELLPQDLKIEIEQLEHDEAREVAGYLATVVGKAHARQMDRSARKEWRAELQRSRSKSLDAPSWLWRDVVDLLSDHERAYLEHCRRYALAA